MSKPVIKVTNLTKKFHIFKSNRARLISAIFNREGPVSFTALSNISFEINKGDVVAILGRRGSGRSTLIKILSGITTPDHGSAEVDGEITPVFQTRIGFNRDFTLRENIYLRGAYLGLTKAELKKQEQEILEFAEAVNYADKPLKECPKPIITSLAFAICTCVPKDIILIDYFLSGPITGIKRKFFDRFKEFAKQKDTTILIVSNTSVIIRNLCSRGILLSNGEIIFDGDIDEALKQFKLTPPSSNSPQSENDYNETEDSNEIDTNESDEL